MKNVDTVLGLISPVLQTCLFVLLIRRRVYKSFPFFVLYTGFAIVAETCKLAFLFRHQNTVHYFYLYWGAEAFYAVLGFLAIHEVFRRVFENFNGLPWFKFLWPAVGLLMFGISVTIPMVHPAVDTEPLLEGIYSLQIAVRCLQLGIFFLIFFLARVFDLDYRQYAFGIAVGFGIAAAGILTATLVRTGLGLKYLIFFQYFPSVAYCIAVTVWLASFVRPEPDDPFRDFRHMFTPELFLGQLARYKQQVRSIFGP
ncbi:MAG: hypothetical protein JWM83_330 [Candidatus Angelobacter sp.]|nr:hypothetical protein [Candidatus Angelobacter sp.]